MEKKYEGKGHQAINSKLIVKDRNSQFVQVSNNLWNNTTLTSPKMQRYFHATNQQYDSKSHHSYL